MRNRVIAACGLGLLVAAALVLRPWAWGWPWGWPQGWGRGPSSGGASAAAGGAETGGGGEATADAGDGAREAGRSTVAGGAAAQSDPTPPAADTSSRAGAPAGGAAAVEALRHFALQLQRPQVTGGDESAEDSDAAGSGAARLGVIRLQISAADTFGAPLALWQPEKYLADLNDDGELDLFDLAEFQRRLEAGDMSADFDGDGTLDVMDSVAFQSELAAKTIAPDETPATINLRFALIDAAAESRFEVSGPEVELQVRKILEQARDQ